MPHDESGRAVNEWQWRSRQPMAAGSLVTTINDYAKFLSAMLSNRKSDHSMHPQILLTTEIDQMLQPQFKPKEGRLRKPGIFFIHGLNLKGFSGDTGVETMASHFKDAKVYSWQDEDKIIAEILKRKVGQPIILVGHSLGGDAAVNIGKRINNIEHGFRKIDLMVTMDSVGFDNDQIRYHKKDTTVTVNGLPVNYPEIFIYSIVYWDLNISGSNPVT